MLNELKNKLYGDGINDDTQAIQELLDNNSYVELPIPQDCYLISKPLILHNSQELKLTSTTVIKLMPDSNCPMLCNESLYCDDNIDKNIMVSGGIWDYNNLNQRENPLASKSVNVDWGSEKYSTEYLGVVFRFAHINGLTIRSLTLKDPITFAVQIACAKYFTIENIRFDFNEGNPYTLNMDGIHLDGNCEYGVIRNLMGTCYDDMIALNANDFYDGPIRNIQIDGLFADYCHSAVRLLSAHSEVKNITISNVYGHFYQYCIGFTKYYETRGELGIFDNITIRDLYASKAERPALYDRHDDRVFMGDYIYSFIWVEGKTDIDHLTIDGLHRCETVTPVPTMYISPNATIHNCSFTNVSQENHTGEPLPFIENDAIIENLYFRNVDIQNSDEIITGSGEVKKVICDD